MELAFVGRNRDPASMKKAKRCYVAKANHNRFVLKPDWKEQQ